jgi:uncharacterized protein
LTIIIDGYNVLHATGLLRAPGAPGNLERARLALLNFLCESLEPAELAATTVVFDACHGPYGSPRTFKHRGLTVSFAANYENADELIEELIHRAPTPRVLTVVSSDHRLRQAAHRRKAACVDSEAWYDDLLRRRRERQAPTEEPDTEEPADDRLSAENVEYWLRQFGVDESSGGGS